MKKRVKITCILMKSKVNDKGNREMTNSSGYNFTKKIHENEKALFFRGRRLEDQTVVIGLFLKDEYTGLVDSEILEHKYILNENTKINGILELYDIQEYNGSLLLIMEDFEKLLSDIMRQEWISLKKFLKIAVNIVNILENLHSNNIIHSNINPFNIMGSLEDEQFKITDPRIASLFFGEQQIIDDSSCVAGRLAYISPEQTGRIERRVDYRTDFYSLGITFYEILAGQLPFSSKDDMELLHCHLAQEARAKRYSRDKELQLLVDSFCRVKKGSKEILLISGPPGIGKTAVVEKGYKLVRKNQGTFISGKFEQFKTNTAYSAFIQVFRGLIKEILTESDTRIASWKKKLNHAVGDNGRAYT